ncbi:MAG: hypothetical protein C4534_00830 [Gaiellales bacterium]|nr:MAG: hypothetical protein C4534_00830 [Gaiellales bacterium]
MESRVTRLHEKRRIGRPGRPVLDHRAEIRSVAWFAALGALAVALLAGLLYTGIVGRDSDVGLLLGLSPGMVLTAALASSLTFLIVLRHQLLLLALSAVFIAAGGLMLALVPVESLAKVLFAVCLGLWISLMLSSISQILLIAALIIIVDFYSVFYGPTKMMIESSSGVIDYLTISLPVFGVDAASRLGASDIIFFSLFVGTTLIYGLRRELTAIAMTLSLIGTMIAGVMLGYGVPALPLISVFFLLTNFDLLYRRFLDEPDEIRKRENGS